MKFIASGMHRLYGGIKADLLGIAPERRTWAMIDVLDVGFYRIKGTMSDAWNTHVRALLDERISEYELSNT